MLQTLVYIQDVNVMISLGLHMAGTRVGIVLGCWNNSSSLTDRLHHNYKLALKFLIIINKLTLNIYVYRLNSQHVNLKYVP